LRQWIIDTSLDVMGTMRELGKYTNGVIRDIHARYNSKTPSFLDLP